MKNLTLQIYLTLALLIWTGSSFRCSMMQGGFLVYPSRYLLDTEQVNTINRLLLEDTRRVQTQVTLKEKQRILFVKRQKKDGLLLNRYKTLDSIGSVLLKPSFTSTMMIQNPQMLSGRTSTVGNTLIDE